MNRLPLWAGIFIAIGVLVLVHVLDRHNHQLAAERTRVTVERDLAAVSARIEGLLYKHLYLAEGLATYVSARPQLKHQEFTTLARDLARDAALVPGVFLVQREQIVYSFYQGEVATLGASLPTLLPAINGQPLQRAIATRHSVVSGPVQLSTVPVYVVSMPVFLPSAEGDKGVDNYWGSVNLLLDGEELLRRAGIEHWSGGSFALRTETGVKSATAGESDLFEQAGVVQPIHLPGTQWQIAAVLPVIANDAAVPRLLGILLALLSGALVYVLLHERQSMKRMAMHDCLTGLPNRLLLRDRLQQACGIARRTERDVAVMYLDLDHFKPVNDLHGHQAGDKALLEVARRLNACVRSSDTVARVSGDEFVVLLNNTAGTGEIEQVAEKVLAQFSLPISLGQHSCTLGVSIGLCMLDDDCDVDEALARADSAMYEAKRDGKNTYRWWQGEPEQLELAVAQALV